jgi:hypothetical protein
MSVATLLNELKGRGISVVVEGSNLRLKGTPGSWDDLRDRLRAAKAELIAVLTTPPGWGAQDWLDCYEERATNAELHAHSPREDAARLARLYCRLEWSRQNPPGDPGAGICVHCRKPVIGTSTVIYTTAGERTLHEACRHGYGTDRARCARQALARMGIDFPPEG